MQGRKIESPFAADGALIGEWPVAGDYWKQADGLWYGVTPNGLDSGLGKHNIVEHEDGSISVAPSILTSRSNPTNPAVWHGYLERGIWRSC